MRTVAAIFKKEIRYYFQSLTAYVMIALFLILSGYFFVSIFRYYNVMSLQAAREQYLARYLNLIDAVMRPLFANVSIVLLFALPLLTMRLLAEEKRQGTFELLLTYPVSDLAVIMGKYLAALTVFAVMLAGTSIHPILLAVFADPEPGPIVTGYIGLFLMGCTFLAMGIFFSSLTSSQIIAGVATFGLSLFILVIGWAAPFAGPTLSKIISQFSLLEHYESFSKGLIEIQDVTYYVFLSVFFLFLTLRSLDSTRWRS